MSIYSLETLISQTRRLARDYKQATGKPLGGVSAEIAQFDACHLLNLEPVAPGQQGGYDAIGRGQREGLKVQIKGRAILDEGKSGQRIGQLKTDQAWDIVVLVLMDENFEAYEIYEADRDEVLDALQSSDSKRAKRGVMSVAKFKAISRLAWTRERGEEDEIWEHQGDP